MKLERGVLQMTWVKSTRLRKGTLGRVPSIQHFNLTPRYVADEESSSMKESSAQDVEGDSQLAGRSMQSPHSMSATSFGERPPTRREIEPDFEPSFETGLASRSGSFVQCQVDEIE